MMIPTIDEDEADEAIEEDEDRSQEEPTSALVDGSERNDNEQHGGDEERTTSALSTSLAKPKVQVQEEDKDARDDESSEEPQQGLWYRHCCLGRFTKHVTLSETWPRTTAILFGILLPLFLLIGLSAALGWWLAALEAPAELDANDFVVSEQAELVLFDDLVSELTVKLPSVCFELYMRNETLDGVFRNISSIIDGDYDGARQIYDFIDEFDKRPIVQRHLDKSVNLTKMYAFMDECGAEFVPVVKGMLKVVASSSAKQSVGLTFNWVQCSNYTDRAAGQNLSFIDTLSPTFQAANYAAYWGRDQKALYEQYLQDANETTNSSVPDSPASFRAFHKSIEEATGRHSCKMDVASAGFFWFTVMSTIGYGNQAPVTEEGRAVVIIFGFMTILLFGFLLANAGHVGTVILYDFIARIRYHHYGRTRHHVVPRSWLIGLVCLFWCLIAYLWMLLIAAIYRQWRRERLHDTEFDLKDGYWFAFISTTTVGLGDYYLDPRVMVGADLVVYPFLFLLAFTYWSSFIGALSQIAQRLFKPARSLEDRLKTKDVLASLKAYSKDGEQKDATEVPKEQNQKGEATEGPSPKGPRSDEED